jgi:SAM-dependent methyltransferase
MAKKTAQRLPQPMRPSGRVGRIFGWLMARLNKPAYRWTVDQLRSIQPKSILEIGFGTGHLLSLAIRKLKPKPKRVAGRDPSDLMVETAQKRLRRFRKKVALDIAKGDDSALPEGPFDAIVALHSFQFWADPTATLAKLRRMLTPEGRLILVLRRHYSGRVSKWIPNPLSHSADEISATCAAAEAAGFTLVGMKGISKSSQGLVLACG